MIASFTPVSSDNTLTSRLTDSLSTALGGCDSYTTDGVQLIADNSMVNAVNRYLSSALAANTKRACAGDLRAFVASGRLLPCDVDWLLAYLVTQAPVVRPSTLRRRLVAIRHFHVSSGYPDPTSAPAVRSCVQGISRLHGRPAMGAQPLLRENVIAAISAIDGSLRGARDAALLAVGFSGAFRRSELSALEVSDLEWRDQGVVITLRRSKTDQYGVGRSVALPWGQAVACPVRLLRTWISRASINGGSLFRSIAKGGRLGTKISSDAINSIVQARFSAIGISVGAVSSHGLRSGFVTSAVQREVGSLKIKQQTGHKSDAMVAAISARPICFWAILRRACSKPTSASVSFISADGSAPRAAHNLNTIRTLGEFWPRSSSDM